MAIRLTIADDHLLFRQGLRSLLQLHDDIEIVGEVETVAGLRGVLAATTCDILLLDLQMERSSTDEISELSQITKVIVLTANESTEMGKRALRFGGEGDRTEALRDRNIDQRNPRRRGGPGLDARRTTGRARNAAKSPIATPHCARGQNCAMRRERPPQRAGCRTSVDRRKYGQNASRQNF